MENNLNNSSDGSYLPSGLGEGVYSIKVKGCLKAHWSEWLAELSITHDKQGNSILTGYIPDQAALHGVLVKIRDLGLILLSVELLENDDEKES